MRISVALALGAALGLPMAAAAQDLDRQAAVECLCVLSVEAGPRPAVVQDVRGQVLLSDAAGYTPIQSTTELTRGDRLILLGDGRAALVAGPNCQVALAPDSMINLISIEAGVCVAHATTAPETDAVIQPAADLPPPMLEAQPMPLQPPPSRPIADAAPALVGGALFAGGAAAIISLADDAPRPVSP